MDVIEAIKTRRSIRSYEKTPIPKEALMDLVEAGIWAPSGGNMQTWRFIIITEPNRIENVKNLSPGISGNPKAIIVICSDLGEAEQRAGRLGKEYLAVMDVSMAAQNILLAAYAKGLGACVIASFQKLALQKFLTLPSTVNPILLIALGYPANVPRAPIRKFKEVVFWETYNEQKY
jgi:nitroreductase